MPKAKEVREMSDEQLGFELTETEKKLFKLRCQATTEKLDTPSILRKLRRDIARIATVLGEKSRASGAKA